MVGRFKKRNAAVLQEYLAVVDPLMEFDDAKLIAPSEITETLSRSEIPPSVSDIAYTSPEFAKADFYTPRSIGQSGLRAVISRRFNEGPL